MKKFLLSLFCLIAGVTAFAETCTETISKVDAKSTATKTSPTVSKTYGDITVTFTRNSGNEPGFYTSSGILRYYSKDVMNFSSEYNITKIEFTMNSGTPGTITTGSLTTSSPYIWTGSSTSVDFTGSGTVKINKVVITYEKPDAPVGDDPVLNVSDETIDFGSILSGATIPTQTLKVNAANLAEGVVPTYAWANGGIFNAEGTLTAEGGELTIALASSENEGKYADVLTVTAGELTATVNVYAKVITLAGEGDGTEANPYNVTRALDILNNGLQAATEVYISGIISTVTEVSAQFGNGTYNISDDGTNAAELVVFRGKYLDNAAFTDENQIAVSDEVTVYGKLINYVDKNTGFSTPEVAQGNYLVALKHNGTEPVKELGDIVVTGITEGATVFEGTTVTISAENAETIAYTLNGGAAVTVEGSTATVTLALGDTSLAAVATLGEATKALATITFTVVEKPEAKAYTAVLYGKKYATADEVKAADVTFAVEEPASSAKATWTIKDVVTVTSKGAAGAYDEIRVYKSQNLVFTPAAGVTITKITFNVTADKYKKISGNDLSFDGLVGTWEGEATSALNFSIASDEQARFSTIVIDFESSTFTPGVKKQESTVTFAEKTVEQALNANYVGQVATCSVEGATLKYTSSNINVATVDEATGAVTLKGLGETIIKATFEGNDEYYGSEDTYTLNVVAPVIEGQHTYEGSFVEAAKNNSTVAVGDAMWTVNLTNASDDDPYTGYTNGAAQFGSSKNGIDEVVLLSESFEGYNITGITINGRTSADSATLTYYVGNEAVKVFDMTTATQNANYTWIAESPITDADAIKIVYKQTSGAKAFFVKSISVTYTDPELPDNLSGRHFRTYINGEETSIWNVQLKSGDNLKIRTIPGLQLYYKFVEVSPIEANMAQRVEGNVDDSVDTSDYTLNAGNVFNYTVPELGNGKTYSFDFVLQHPVTNEQLVRDLTISSNGMTGVENVDAENADAPVEYFNLQGQRVNEPANGIFIRRQGNKVTKVVK